ncbi:hypothetical protein [Marinicella litoralis]|uniref:Uncharacterized protein n=1 Tax=Marinicella litoralis TaxID=644220 RepID=A0A4V3DJ00_9GAMM|nr:hypothetical protein [Marinicella litoralis]TDR23811.1 hypothetical protein C8D91_0677 [Marinicella litoralis]
MKKSVMVLIVLLLMGCGEAPTANQQSTTKQTANNKTSQAESSQLNTPPVSTQGVDFSAYMNKDSICGILSQDALHQMFNIPGEITTEVEHSGAVTCRYSWSYKTLKDRKQATDNGKSYDFGQASKYSARAISNEARLIISLSATEKTAVNFVPEILNQAEIEAQIEQLKAETTDRNQSMDHSELEKLLEKKKQSLIKKNQLNTAIDHVGDAAYWTQIAGGGLHVLAGQVHVYISPLIATEMGADVENAVAVLARMVGQ